MFGLFFLTLTRFQNQIQIFTTGRSGGARTAIVHKRRQNHQNMKVPSNCLNQTS